jgi:hypothetical protein
VLLNPGSCSGFLDCFLITRSSTLSGFVPHSNNSGLVDFFCPALDSDFPFFLATSCLRPGGAASACDQFLTLLVTSPTPPGYFLRSGQFVLLHFIPVLLVRVVLCLSSAGRSSARVPSSPFRVRRQALALSPVCFSWARP